MKLFVAVFAAPIYTLSYPTISIESQQFSFDRIMDDSWHLTVIMVVLLVEHSIFIHSYISSVQCILRKLRFVLDVWKNSVYVVAHNQPFFLAMQAHTCAMTISLNGSSFKRE